MHIHRYSAYSIKYWHFRSTWITINRYPSQGVLVPGPCTRVLVPCTQKSRYYVPGVPYLKDRTTYNPDSIDFLILHCFSVPEVVCNNKVTTTLLKHITYIDIHSNGDGESLLHHAVEYNRISLVKALLDRGIDREAEDDSGRTPLTLASRYECIDIVKLLLSYNSTIDNTTTMSMYSVLDALANIAFFRKTPKSSEF